VGGEVQFSPTYQGNPLVNAMCVGLLPAEAIMRGTASGVGNPVFVVGARTGRDGIHGATFASAENPDEKERSAVQVGDPFLGKLLMEACLELIASGAVVGIQDMGAAGLTSSSAEMASRAGGGIEMTLDRVPVREAGMTPYEMMLSESQERMLVVLERGRESVAFDIFRRYGLDVADVGRVTDDGRLRLIWQGEVVADMPVAALVDEAPLYSREVGPAMTPVAVEVPADGSIREALRTVLSHPSVADKGYVYRQYDSAVRASTVMGPGYDAALVKVPEADKAVAMATDGTSRYVALNPRKGGQIAVAEAVRNVATVGALPLAITNCLNFGNPEKPAVMRQLQDAIEGMADACRRLGTPVVSGNVSLYNESHGTDIQPTPVVGAVGVLRGLDLRIPLAPMGDGAAKSTSLYLLGREDDELGGTLYAEIRMGRPVGDAPYVNLEEEAKLHQLIQACAKQGLVLAAHDVSEGGVAVTLAEMMFASGLGGEVQVHAGHQPIRWLFSEAQGRIVVAVAEHQIPSLTTLATAHGVPLRHLGRLKSGDGLTVEFGDGETETMSLQ
ncbi:MAG: phosphoribosylformylglycinamidine synthase subunit PurL, partial [Firmicutes bacterium]|nr:phosphoribosylformylglycinamidine synthase subunit PurL [Bacillota bacterium]